MRIAERAGSLLDGGRREAWLAGAVAVGLVLLRSFVAVRYEGFYFDSDQAIVGLMAKHVAEFRHFPIFYYSLNYLLAVEAWLIAPFFWIARPSVAVMRVPLVALNVVVALWLIALFRREHRLRPAVAFLAALPFIVPGPAAANHLLETAGSSIEPFVYVLLLWTLRKRPLPFGIVLGIGFLHREFTIFALPALLMVELTQSEFWTRAKLQWAGRVALGFGAVWVVVDDLKAHLGGGSLGLQAASLRGQMCFDAQWRDRVMSLLTSCLPSLFGGTATPLQGFRMNTPLVAGSSLAGWVIAGAALVMVLRLAATMSRRAEQGNVSFGVYLMLVGIFTAAAYPLSCNILPGAPPLLRYAVLALFVPVGLSAAFLARERSARVRIPVACVLAAWAVFNTVDNARLVVASVNDPPSNEHRALADYLTDHSIRYARGTYFDAYAVDFLARERVIVGSTDIVRIEEYEKRVDEHPEAAVTLLRLPCGGAERVASWCIARP